ncbi:MAG: TetR/AcrR family transcriptional regulator [Actinomycetota bacterium]|nr:TetR/AcrR family transcriptional regulator [Actinomycetota bacterium]
MSNNGTGSTSRTTARRRRRYQANTPSIGDQRRELVLDNFETLLTRKPVAEVSMEAIAAAASLSRTSVYFYFASKADALEALIGRASDEMRSNMNGRVEGESLHAFVTRIIEATVEGWRRHQPIFAAAIELSSHQGHDALRWRSVMQDFAQNLADGLRLGSEEIPADVALQRGEIICWMVERNFYFLFISEHSAEDERNLVDGLISASYAVLVAPLSA